MSYNTNAYSPSSGMIGFGQPSTRTTQRNWGGSASQMGSAQQFGQRGSSSSSMPQQFHQGGGLRQSVLHNMNQFQQGAYPQKRQQQQFNQWGTASSNADFHNIPKRKSVRQVGFGQDVTTSPQWEYSQDVEKNFRTLPNGQVIEEDIIQEEYAPLEDSMYSCGDDTSIMGYGEQQNSDSSNTRQKREYAHVDENFRTIGPNIVATTPYRAAEKAAKKGSTDIYLVDPEFNDKGRVYAYTGAIEPITRHTEFTSSRGINQRARVQSRGYRDL